VIKIKKKFQIYSDESNYNKGRFRSIAAISGKRNTLKEAQEILSTELDKYNITEVKWGGVKSHYPKIQAAYQFIEVLFNYILRKKVRVDIIIWDTYDFRHKIKNRDDKVNFEIMYYNLLRHISRRYKNYIWDFFPDQQSMINWEKMREFLNNTYESKSLNMKTTNKAQCKIKFDQVDERDSKKAPLIQLADLFAGIGNFSRENKEKYRHWKINIKSDKQISLFDNHDISNELSKADEKRFKFIEDLYNKSKNNNLSISLNKNQYLKTYNPNCRINFWHYTPKRMSDKAPTKN
jgi:hypothetical protein